VEGQNGPMDDRIGQEGAATCWRFAERTHSPAELEADMVLCAASRLGALCSGQKRRSQDSMLMMRKRGIDSQRLSWTFGASARTDR
jgi:hypothetical protein